MCVRTQRRRRIPHFCFNLISISVLPAITFGRFPFRNSRESDNFDRTIESFNFMFSHTTCIIENLLSRQTWTKTNFLVPNRTEKGIRNKRKKESNLIPMRFDVNACVCACVRVYQVYLDNATFICHIKSLDANAVVFRSMREYTNTKFSVFGIVSRLCVLTHRELILAFNTSHVGMQCEKNGKKNQNLTTDNIKIWKMIKMVPSTSR